jgi:hypothetical protein
MGVGYIPWAPLAGRHVMDDFGWLVQALPQDHYHPDPTWATLWYHWSQDLVYFFH